MSSAAEYIPTVPALIAEALHNQLPDLRECKEAPGQFNLDEIKRIGANAPSVRIALLGMVPRNSGNPYHRLELAAFITTKDQRGLARHRAAQAISAQIVDQITAHQNWGEAHLGDCQLLEARNLHNSNTGSRGVALWGIRWRQQIDWEFAEQPAPSRLKHLYIGMTPKIGPENIGEYERIGGDDDA